MTASLQTSVRGSKCRQCAKAYVGRTQSEVLHLDFNFNKTKHQSVFKMLKVKLAQMHTAQ